MGDTFPRHITYLGISIVQSESQNKIFKFKIWNWIQCCECACCWSVQKVRRYEIVISWLRNEGKTTFVRCLSLPQMYFPLNFDSLMMTSDFHKFLRAQVPGSAGTYFQFLWQNITNWWAKFGRLPEGFGWAGDGLKLLKGSLRDAWRPGGVRP